MWKNILSAVSFAAAFVVEAWALHGLLREGRDGSVVSMDTLAIHAVGLGFGAVGLVMARPSSLRMPPLAFAALFLGLCLPLPLVGLLVLAAFRMLLLLKPSRPRRSDYVLGDQQFLTREKPDHVSLDSPQSVLQILSGTNESLRRTAIIALRSVDPKKALPLLQKAIQDSDEQVRLLAQTQFNRILGDLETDIKRMEGELAESSREAGRLTALAEHYHELVHLGVSSPETEGLHLERARDLLSEALAQAPQNSAARFLMLKCSVKSRNLPAAKESARQLEACGFPPDALAPWEAELHFLERDWAALRESLRRMAAFRNVNPRLSVLIEFWLNPTGEPGGRADAA